MFRKLEFGEGAVDFCLVNSAISAFEQDTYPAAVAGYRGEGVAPAPHFGQTLAYLAFVDNIDTGLFQ